MEYRIDFRHNTRLGDTVLLSNRLVNIVDKIIKTAFVTELFDF